jgi:hypothetical protein
MLAIIKTLLTGWKSRTVVAVIVLGLAGFGVYRTNFLAHKSGKSEILAEWAADNRKKADVSEAQRKAEQAAANAIDESVIPEVVADFQKEFEIQERKEYEKANSPVFYARDCNVPDGLMRLYSDAIRSDRKD